MRLPQPFLVMATQNPIEYEGTFPLPEAQLDRFMLKLTVGYPSVAEEKEILHRRHERRQEEVLLSKVTMPSNCSICAPWSKPSTWMRTWKGYIAAIVHATRSDRRVAVGSSPRGSLAFLKMARAHAALDGRDYILPDDVKRYAVPVLSHRLILHPEYWMSKQITGEVIRDVLEKTPVPVSVSWSDTLRNSPAGSGPWVSHVSHLPSNSHHLRPPAGRPGYSAR
jgi:MoxR-like ATPase